MKCLKNKNLKFVFRQFKPGQDWRDRDKISDVHSHSNSKRQKQFGKRKTEEAANTGLKRTENKIKEKYV